MIAVRGFGGANVADTDDDEGHVHDDDGDHNDDLATVLPGPYRPLFPSYSCLNAGRPNT
ncbi:hypothetical protein DPMN_073202 [Dreissena polymorpha]|uniref:Uncharacterized protein n=1 Tax=Dreissena polymorpha TaxID=45954 RepID=A0A9D4BYL7_DREPO|nr:hypothetical protein DPMN_073202 [Dreissena polymorpha]